MDSSNSDVVEKELVKTCETAKKKDEKFVSFKSLIPSLVLEYCSYCVMRRCDAEVVLLF